MKHLLGLAVMTVAATASASVDQQTMCVPRGAGVPTREGPPKWVAWTGTNAIPADPSLDDPRWVGATGDSFVRGSAKAPLQTRLLFGTDGAAGDVTKYLYLSFIVDLTLFDTTASHPSSVTPRDVFVAFHRAGTAGSSGTERGYMFQFHLTGSGAGVVAPTYCDVAGSCVEGPGTGRDYWRVFVDKGHVGTSACDSSNGRLYEPLGAAGPAPIAWVTGGGQDAVRYWKLVTGAAATEQNRWAVQIRIPIVRTGLASPITQGVEDGATVAYEVTAKLAGAGNGNFAKVGRFPHYAPELTSVCPDLNSDGIVDAELGNAGDGCTACDPGYFAKLTDLGVEPAASCPEGLDLDADHIGTVFNTALPADHEAITIGRTFGARDTTTPNHVVALPVNTKPAAAGGVNTITAPIMARFRLAGWGSQPWSDENDLGTWKDLRGSGTGVCATPPSGSEICGATPVEPQKHALITFDWTIGGDRSASGLGASEYCKYGLTPPAASGEVCDATACSCADAADCAPSTGVRATKSGGGFWPCVPSIFKGDQCLLVELSSPNGEVHFKHQSVRSNMRFANLSTTAREALIDARKLPVAPGQKFQDIYLAVMPRNMPASVPPTTTSVALAQDAALDAASRIAAPYAADARRIPPQALAAMAVPAAAQTHVREDDKRLADIRLARRVMPPADLARVDGLLGIALANPDSNTPSQTLVQNAVQKLGSSVAADVVSTLEIYPYYQPLGKGPAYEPMTSFSLFLSHEGTLSGMTYAIDGADKVSDNVYHLRIPVGFARRIQVRAQAVVGTEPPLAAGRPKWPCGTCCSQRCGLVASLGNSVPGLLAGVFVVGRRRRRNKAVAK